MIVEQKVEYSTALIAKKKGFNEKCLFFYNGDVLVESGGYNTNQLSYKYSDRYCTAPTQSLLQRWLRDIYHIHCEAIMYIDNGLYKYISIVKTDFDYDMFVMYEQTNINSSEKALEIALEEGLKLIIKTKETDNGKIK